MTPETKEAAREYWIDRTDGEVFFSLEQVLDYQENYPQTVENKVTHVIEYDEYIALLWYKSRGRCEQAWKLNSIGIEVLTLQYAEAILDGIDPDEFEPLPTTQEKGDE